MDIISVCILDLSARLLLPRHICLTGHLNWIADPSILGMMRNSAHDQTLFFVYLPVRADLGHMSFLLSV